MRRLLATTRHTPNRARVPTPRPTTRYVPTLLPCCHMPPEEISLIEGSTFGTGASARTAATRSPPAAVSMATRETLTRRPPSPHDSYLPNAKWTDLGKKIGLRGCGRLKRVR